MATLHVKCNTTNGTEDFCFDPTPFVVLEQPALRADPVADDVALAVALRKIVTTKLICLEFDFETLIHSEWRADSHFTKNGRHVYMDHTKKRRVAIKDATLGQFILTGPIGALELGRMYTTRENYGKDRHRFMVQCMRMHRREIEHMYLESVRQQEADSQ